MIEVTTSGRLRSDPWKESRTHVDGDQVLVVCAWLWCDVRDPAGAWVYVIAAKPEARAVLADLRKDDHMTVHGEVRALRVHKDDGKPFVELVVYSICSWRHMAEVDEGLAVH
jgi:hypothetical protein